MGNGHLAGGRGTAAALTWGGHVHKYTWDIPGNSKKYLKRPLGAWPTEKRIISADVTPLAPAGCTGLAKVTLTLKNSFLFSLIRIVPSTSFLVSL